MKKTFVGHPDSELVAKDLKTISYPLTYCYYWQGEKLSIICRQISIKVNRKLSVLPLPTMSKM